MTARTVLTRVLPQLLPTSTTTGTRWRGHTAASRRGMAALEELGREKKAESVGLSAAAVDVIDYQRPLKVVDYPDPRLRLPNAKIRFPAKGIEQLAADMFEIMYSDDGVGLAAPQVGVNVQMLVFNPDGAPARGDKSKEMVLINPKIIKFGKETHLIEEGCLSFYQPTVIRGYIERPTTIKIKAQDVTGAKLNLVLEGLPARIFQHEYDHLQSILFFERMNAEVFASVKSELIQYEEEYLRKNPNIEIQRIQQ